VREIDAIIVSRADDNGNVEIRAGTLTALYLFDVAEHFDLKRCASRSAPAPKHG
jgi:hypothetical protein